AAYASEKCIHELFEAQVERRPEAIAVVSEEGSVTYGELNRRANQLAHYLKAVGVGPGLPVGICVDRSMEMVIGLLGILKAGGAYSPLGPCYPKDRLAFILDDAHISILLTTPRSSHNLPQHQLKAVSLYTEWKLFSKKTTHKPANTTALNSRA